MSVSIPEHDLQVVFAQIARVLEKGDRPPSSLGHWRSLTVSEHIDHALAHLEKIGLPDSTEDDLVHATCRLMLAIAQRERLRLN